jgi:hypothetical protein
MERGTLLSPSSPQLKHLNQSISLAMALLLLMGHNHSFETRLILYRKKIM